MRAFLFAVSFLTRLPLPAFVHEVEPKTLARGPLWFPLVGGLIGAVTGLVALGLSRFVSPWLAVLIALAIEARLTGAMHEDALADCFDALGGGWSRQRTLEIFKDSRLGTYGVLALILGVAIRAAASHDVLAGSSDQFVLTLALAGFAGRLSMVFFLKLLPPIKRRESLASGFGEDLGWFGVAASALPLAGFVGWISTCNPRGLQVSLVLSLLLLAFAFRLVRRRLGGSTGDVLGCVAYLGQLATLVGMSASF